jgi:hypothetical protein
MGVSCHRQEMRTGCNDAAVGFAFAGLGADGDRLDRDHLDAALRPFATKPLQVQARWMMMRDPSS